ncbi:phosphatidylinositol 4-kinase beta-like [Octopus sinensis]|uniref:Phosphatidylinositol 4-kinase beta n=1 Tax=Octopus sinensis TaxID=2607531 RepID=A0A6P7TS80_9MOLL|nr:phosphatidylinositol 4-kinase beta-like [Octopus sinensis]
MRGSPEHRRPTDSPLAELPAETTREAESVKGEELFEGLSTSWDVVNLLGHLFKCKQKSVRQQLALKLQEFPQSEEYLAQLLSMHVTNYDGGFLEEYLLTRCRSSVRFAVSCSLMLKALSVGYDATCRPLERYLWKAKKSHRRTYSDRERGGFDSGCRCPVTKSQWVDAFARGEVEYGRGTSHCRCQINLIRPQVAFLSQLTALGCEQCLFHERLNVLVNQLKCLNSSLPAPVWLPFSTEHVILNICENETVILNSKPNAPFLVYVEALQRQAEATISTYSKSESNLQSNSVYCQRVSAASIRHRLQHSVTPLSVSSSKDSTAMAPECWNVKKARIRATSLFGDLPNWSLWPVIVKRGDDLRQEVMISQVGWIVILEVIGLLQESWEVENVRLWVRPVRVYVTGSLRGLIEYIPDTASLHQIKKRGFPRLNQYFVEQFGLETSEKYLCARENFVRSCAGYCVVCYLLQVKDRHNGNILLDAEGHMLHIDFAFVMSSSPGRNLGFEVSPFKLTDEFVEVMGGLESDMFRFFKSLIFQGLVAARKHVERIITLMEIMQVGNPTLPCFKNSTCSIQSKRLSNLTYSVIDTELLTWMEYIELRRQFLDDNSILLKAKNIANIYGIKEFKASNGWLSKFKIRNNLKLRTLHGESGSTAVDQKQEIDAFTSLISAKI